MIKTVHLRTVSTNSYVQHRGIGNSHPRFRRLLPLFSHFFNTFKMFLPENAQGNNAEKQRKAAYKEIEEWSLKLIPEPIRKDGHISIQEVQCGDPQCSPIDTAITVIFERYVRRILREEVPSRF